MFLFYSTVVQGGVNLFDHAFKIRIVNVKKVIEVPRSRIKSLDKTCFVNQIVGHNGLTWPFYLTF